MPTSDVTAQVSLALSYPENPCELRGVGGTQYSVFSTQQDFAQGCNVCVCVYYCRTYDKAVCGGGGGQCGTREEPGTFTQGAPVFPGGTREEPGTLTPGAPCVCLLLQDLLQTCSRATVFPGSSRLGIEPKTPGWLVQDPTTRPIGDLIPTIGGSGAHPFSSTHGCIQYSVAGQTGLRT